MLWVLSYLPFGDLPCQKRFGIALVNNSVSVEETFSSHATPLQVSGGATQEHLIHFGADYPLGRAGQP
jgi:hypothetical protein